jgi:hypothetical protein
LREVEAPTFSDIQLTDGGKVVSLARRPLFTSRKILGTHLLEAESTPRDIMRLEGLDQLKKIHLIRDSNQRPPAL